MQSTRNIEIWVGIFVALGIVALLMLSMKVSHLGNLLAEQGYTVTAQFENIGGLKVKSPVKMSGVLVGRITNISYDDDSYQAIVTMNIDSKYRKIPIDSSPSVFTAGLLGEQYVDLGVGGDEEFLVDGDEFDPGLTQSAIIVEKLVGEFLLNMASKDTSE
ncbi:outer membrane lipid asymmetry maintenance protein MlaD [Candidatus Halobeggiatoa sp. HSG11]|nr:outer membrane lipid asymmetry maintenance protein MlaD [Candidatus Halobeggiatoa sp. HSG11]